MSPQIFVFIFNLLFVGSYATLATHSLFLANWNTTDTSVIILGISIYGTTQVGGVWLLSLINEKLTKSIGLLLALRVAAIATLIFPSALAVAISLTLFGLSHAIYYKISRQVAAAILKSNPSGASNIYTYLSLSTNLVFVLLPYIGSNLIASRSLLAIGTLVTFSFCLISIFLLRKYRLAFFVEEAVSNDQSLGKIIFSRELVFDGLRFLACMFPYAFLMALLPIKASLEPNGVKINSLAMAINSGTVILFQLISFRIPLSKYSLRRYDIYSAIAVGLCLAAPLTPIYFTLLIFFFWSICEAYQLPNIDYLLFSERKYSSQVINQILALDAVVCFLGPQLAGLFK